MGADGRTGRLDIGGVKLEYERIGPSPDEATTLVFLHEGLSCAALWKDFPGRVAEASGLGVLVYSRQGYGGSDPVDVPRPLTYMHDEGLRVLPKVLDAAAVRSTILVGHSDGASIALIHAGGRRDPRLRSLVLMAPHVFNEDLSVRSIRAAKEAYEHGGLRTRLARYHRDNVDCAFWGWNRAWLDPGFRDWNIEEFLPSIAIPSLLIQGKDDEYGTERQVEAIRSQVAGPVELLMLPDCRHAPHRDQPEATLDAIKRFTERYAGPRPASAAIR
ncbi:MAG: 2-succinyl-6-hydroxy-2,4-cyclohexadiene-1-carboxylate synthase [Gammaproteobacteria bacterium]|nr:2-succinyl-6-hydroxy-2,4-cyclohexadiene-1-carboxylate synthase [Gammaproteobacteria bacterium]